MIYLILLWGLLSLHLGPSWLLPQQKRPCTGRKQQPANSPLPGSGILYAQALLSSLKFPERQKAEKALMITPVRES